MRRAPWAGEFEVTGFSFHFRVCQSSPHTTTSTFWGGLDFIFSWYAGLGYAGQVRRNCRLRRQFRIFFPGKNPDLGAAMPGRRGLCRAAGASQPLAKKSVLQSSPHGTTGIFFLGKIPTLARAWQAAGYAGQARPGRLLCRAGAAGWRSAKPYDRMIRMIRMTRRAGVSGKNMFIRHVEIKRFWWLGAAEMRTRVALVWHLKKLSV